MNDNRNGQSILKTQRTCRAGTEYRELPFGSVLVSQEGKILFEDHNHDKDGDRTQHPEYAVVKWALEHLTEEERRNTVVYTREHCSMCSSAHALAGLGRIVYASSSAQLNDGKKN